MKFLIPIGSILNDFLKDSLQKYLLQHMLALSGLFLIVLKNTEPKTVNSASRNQ